MEDTFKTVSYIIKNRRTIKPNLFNGQQIPDDQIQQLLELADWAPTHGRTEPWRFYVYANNAVKQFCHNHATLYQENTSPEKFLETTFNKLLNMGDLTSHIIVAVMQRGSLPKIPALEEIAATSCAVQNMLLGATALGIATYWGSGGMTHQPAMKTYLNLRTEDIVLGILYLGYSEQPAVPGKRNTPLSEKITWHK